jgi:hypothetical protein
VDAAEEALAGSDIAIESRRNLVEPVADLDLLLAMGLEVLEDGRVDHVGTVVGRHFDWCAQRDGSDRVVTSGTFVVVWVRVGCVLGSVTCRW